MTNILLIQSLICLINSKNRIAFFEPTTAQLYQKQYKSFGGIASIKMQTIIIYSVTVRTEFIDSQICQKSEALTFYNTKLQQRENLLLEYIKNHVNLC